MPLCLHGDHELQHLQIGHRLELTSMVIEVGHKEHKCQVLTWEAEAIKSDR